MLDESENARQKTRIEFETMQQLMIAKTEQVLAAIAHHNEVRDSVERKLAQLEICVMKLENSAI